MTLYKITSLLSVKIKYSVIRGGTFYYYRKVPVTFQDAEGTYVRQSTGTSDPLKAAPIIKALNSEAEARWTGKSKALDNEPLQAKGIRLLAQYGLAPNGDHDDHAFDHFIESVVTPHRERYADEGEDIKEKYDRFDTYTREGLSPIEVAAVKLLNNPPVLLLSDAVKIFLEYHQKTGADFADDTNRNWNTLIDLLGDKPFMEVTRDDANGYVQKRMALGLKTGTIRRQLNSITAIFNKVITEKELHKSNPFKRLTISAEGEDAEGGTPFTTADLTKVQAACRAIDDDVRWLIALQSDLGCRIAEAAGLALNDLVLDAETPHVIIQVHPWRSLKVGKKNERTIPLVGASLWAAQRIRANATEGQTMAFPRYCSEDGCSSTAASATVNKWLRSTKLGLSQRIHGSHDFRHSMKDRLRDVLCPETLSRNIGGWKVEGEAEGYGKGYTLTRMKEQLDKVVLPAAPKAAPAA